LPPNDVSEISVSGSAWLGKGYSSIWTMMEESFPLAVEEILIAAYAVSENSYMIFDLIEKVLRKGIKIMIVINRFWNQSKAVRDRLIHFNETFINFTLLNFEPKNQAEDLHAKIIVIDRTFALLGSANLTWKGLVNNHEIMVKLSGNMAWKLGKLIDIISSNPNTKLVDKKSG